MFYFPEAADELTDEAAQLYHEEEQREEEEEEEGGVSFLLPAVPASRCVASSISVRSLQPLLNQL